MPTLETMMLVVVLTFAWIRRGVAACSSACRETAAWRVRKSSSARRPAFTAAWTVIERGFSGETVAGTGV